MENIIWFPQKYEADSLVFLWAIYNKIYYYYYKLLMTEHVG